MFSSQWLISKKGPLGTIWVASHCLKRLKSDQVKQTDISSSVDKILQDGVPEVTCKILSYLLLGVVRINSKKVNFLLSECCNARDNLNQLVGFKKRNDDSKAADTSTNSISIPERFELDAFDLEVLVDQDFSCRNVKAPEEIMLPDTWKMGGLTNEKYCCDGDLALGAHTPIRDVFPLASWTLI